MSKFKPGDKVKVKKPTGARQLDHPNWATCMDQYNGKTLTVRRLYDGDKNWYKLDEGKYLVHDDTDYLVFHGSWLTKVGEESMTTHKLYSETETDKSNQKIKALEADLLRERNINASLTKDLQDEKDKVKYYPGVVAKYQDRENNLTNILGISSGRDLAIPVKELKDKATILLRACAFMNCKPDSILNEIHALQSYSNTATKSDTKAELAESKQESTRHHEAWQKALTELEQVTEERDALRNGAQYEAGLNYIEAANNQETKLELINLLRWLIIAATLGNIISLIVS